MRESRLQRWWRTVLKRPIWKWQAYLPTSLWDAFVPVAGGFLTLFLVWGILRTVHIRSMYRESLSNPVQSSDLVETNELGQTALLAADLNMKSEMDASPLEEKMLERKHRKKKKSRGDQALLDPGEEKTAKKKKKKKKKKEKKETNSDFGSGRESGDRAWDGDDELGITVIQESDLKEVAEEEDKWPEMLAGSRVFSSLESQEEMKGKAGKRGKGKKI